MKRTNALLSVLVLIFLTAAISCGNSDRNRLRLNVEQLNAECPLSMGDIGVMESSRYNTDKNIVTFTYALSDENLNLKGLAQASEHQKLVLGAFLRTDGKEILDMLVKADASLELVYKAMQSRDSVSVTLWPDELKEMAETQNEVLDDRSQLEHIVAISNAQCPQVIDEGITLTSARLEGDFMVFYYTYDSDMMTIDSSLVDELKSAMKQELAAEMAQPAGESQLKLMKQCGMGFRYIYSPSGSDAETIVVDIEPHEVAQL